MFLMNARMVQILLNQVHDNPQMEASLYALKCV